MPTRSSQRFQLPLAVLFLLAEGSMCDRELIAELPHVLGRRRRSLPHSIYPALEALEAEGLIEAEDNGDTGEPVREGADFFGRPVIIAKRLCDAAQGGQILTSELVRDLAGSGVGQVFKRLGSLALKGLSEPVAATVLGYVPAAESTPSPSTDDRRLRQSQPPDGELLANGLLQRVAG